MDQQVWTVRDVSDWCRKFLQERSPSFRLDSDLLLAKALGCSRIDLYCAFEKPVSSEERSQLKAMLARRADGEPIAYILGARDFYGRDFYVDHRVLVPRPETEHVVEAALGFLRSLAVPRPQVLDVGTGSGCIAITLQAECPEAEVRAWDISAAALEVAAVNAAKHQVDVDFRLQDAFDYAASTDRYQVICANPPYIPKADQIAGIAAKNVCDFEPALALFAGSDGRAFYELFAGHYDNCLENDGRLITEIGYDQGGIVSELFTAKGWRDVQVLKDLSGHDRVVVATKPKMQS